MNTWLNKPIFNYSIIYLLYTFNMRLKLIVIAVVAALSISTPAFATENIVGNGASFPSNLIDECRSSYAKSTGNLVTYSANGSGAGKTSSDKGIGDFWFSDSAHTASTKKPSVIHIPVVAAPIAVMHNLPGSRQLYLSSTTVAKIFAGDITMWNDPAIKADNNRKIQEVIYRKDRSGNLVKDKSGNPVVLRTTSKSIVYTLPNQKIKVVYRLDSSGTTNNFVRFMKANSPEIWTKAVSDSFSTSFPKSINDIGNMGRIVGANQSQGVATLASKTKYSITYAEVSFAKFFKLKVANIGNASGNFVAPDSANVSAFLGEASIDSNNILTYDYATKEPGAYPLGIVSYLLADTAGKNKAAVKEWAKYLVSPECVSAKPELGFALITGKFLEFVNRQINRL
jgi:phosphate transport system substrate-binding protein